MKILLLGKDGQVGWELQRSLSPLGELVALGRKELDVTDTPALRQAIVSSKPAVIVNAAAYTAVDKAESERELAFAVNADAVAKIAEIANDVNAWLVHYSTDYVFDGTRTGPYRETDPINPLSVYGASKAHGEEAVRKRLPTHLIFRTSWVYGTHGANFAKTMLRLARERETLRVVSDQRGAPTSAELIADVTALALQRVRMSAGDSHAWAGTYHLTASGETSWWEYARFVISLAREAGASLQASADRIEPIATESYPTPARRPKNSVLDSRKLTGAFEVRLPDWRLYVARLIGELKEHGAL